MTLTASLNPCQPALMALMTFAASLPVCYMLGSAWESLFHQVILDQPRFSTRKGFSRTGLLSELWFAHFSHHVVHHHLTYRGSYIEQFRSPEHKKELTEKLERMLDDAQMRSVRASKFGLRFTWSGARQFALPLLTLCFGATLMCPEIASKLALIAAVIAGTTPYLAFSRWVHPYLHRPFVDIESASWMMRLLLQSPYGLAMRVGHFVHHQRPVGNFNLQLGYDLFLRKWRIPTNDEWNKMVEIGLVTPLHRDCMKGRRICFHPF